MQLDQLSYYLGSSSFQIFLYYTQGLIIITAHILAKYYMNQKQNNDIFFQVAYVIGLGILQSIPFSYILATNFKNTTNIGLILNFQILIYIIFLTVLSQTLANKSLNFIFTCIFPFYGLGSVDQKIFTQFTEKILPILINMILTWLISLQIDYKSSRIPGEEQQPFFFQKEKVRSLHDSFHQDLLESGENEKLIVKNIDKFFGKFQALNKISFQLKKGITTALLGHNGAGKSTLVNILTGILSPSSGKIKYDGMNFVTEVKRERIKVGICPSFNVLIPEITVHEHLIVAALQKNLKNQQQCIDDVLGKFELDQYKDFKISKLSGGYQRRVMVAISMLGDPNFLFMDEPTSSIDAQSRQELWKIFDDLKSSRKNTITFLTTHHLEEAEYLADDIKIMTQGKIFYQGKKENLMKAFGVGYTISITHSDQDAEGKAELISLKDNLVNEFQNLEENIIFSDQKIKVTVPLEQEKMIDSILKFLENSQSEKIITFLESNSLESAYLKIEQQSNSQLLSESEEKIKEILNPILYAKKPLYFKRFFILFRNHFEVLMSNKLQFLGFITFCLAVILYCFIQFKIGKDMSKQNIESILNQLVYFSIFTEMFIMQIIPYNLINENNNLIKQILMTTKVTSFQYYTSMMLFYQLMISIFAFIQYFGIFLIYNHFYQDEQLLIEFQQSFLKATMCRIAFIPFAMSFIFIFSNKKSLLKYYILLVYSQAIIVLILYTIFQKQFVFYLTNWTFFMNNESSSFWHHLLVYSVQVVIIMGVIILNDIYKINFNFISRINPEIKNKNLQDQYLKTVYEEEKRSIDSPNRFLNVQNLTKKYNERKVVDNISFGIKKGINLGFLGPNGAGKSTSINMIIGKLKKTSGNVIFDQFDPNQYFNPQNSIFNKNQFGIVNQHNSIWDTMKTSQILELFCDLNGIKGSLKDFYEYFYFEEFMNRKMSQLSSGNQRKLAIILSIINKPDIFIYDEATCGVDIIMRLKLKKILDFFKEKNDSIGIHTTHFLKDIDIFCDNISIIKNGKFLYFDNINNMKFLVGGQVLKLKTKKSPDEIMKDFEDLCEIYDVKKFHNDSKSANLKNIKSLSQLLSRLQQVKSQGDYEDFQIRQMSMDDIYIKLIS